MWAPLNVHSLQIGVPRRLYGHVSWAGALPSLLTVMSTTTTTLPVSCTCLLHRHQHCFSKEGALIDSAAHSSTLCTCLPQSHCTLPKRSAVTAEHATTNATCTKICTTAFRHPRRNSWSTGQRTKPCPSKTAHSTQPPSQTQCLASWPKDNITES